VITAKDFNFYFQRQHLLYMMDHLSKWYSVEFVHAHIKRSSLAQVMNMITHS